MSESSSPAAFDEERAAAYDDRIRRLAPGYDVLHEAIACVTDALLPSDAHVLVVGAGTGAGIVTLGQARPGWRFTAVDPSAEMLARCRERVAAEQLDDRVTYVRDRVEDLSAGARFDGATSVFVSHFFQDRAERHTYFRSVGRMLRPDAPLILADLFGNRSDPAFYRLAAAWRRAVLRTGLSLDEVERLFSRIDQQISFVSEEKLKQLLDDAGFGAPTRFHQCLLWGGWWTRKT